MEKQNNHKYGQTDPDFIDQNTLVDGSNILNEDQYLKKVPEKNETIPEFGESDPDYIDQETLVDNDNYAKEEDPYQYKKEFIEEFKNSEPGYENNGTIKSENTNQKKIIKKDDLNTKMISIKK